MVQFKATREEMHTILAIAERAQRMAVRCNVDYDFATAVMDIDACISNGCPLRLEELALAEDGDFAHDVFGIRRHIDRDTGTLRDCFLPRYAR